MIFSLNKISEGKTASPSFGLAILSWLGLACFGPASQAATPLPLPPDIPFPSDIRKEHGIRLTIRFNSGEEVPVLFSTGDACVFLDKSAESALGKRLQGSRIYSPGHGWITASLFGKTSFSLGGTALKLQSDFPAYNGILTIDMHDHQAYQAGARGYLGVDCLKHYCVQIDFENHVLHFLDPDHFDKSKLGIAVPLSIPWTQSQVWVQDGILGKRTERTLINTAFPGDAALNQKLFQGLFDVGQIDVFTNAFRGQEHLFFEGNLTNATFAGEKYRNLKVNEVSDENVLGLGFLAQHFVTFDFPHRRMYLKRLTAKTSAEPLSRARP
ncbi:MAG TPA: hypothetical protein VMF06_18090 [Candidatus Limnocylindria bacterium]|jgi:hypothetical protein|nr:hypothetical protein [Candidatus Limnocylindria bacterium]